MKAPEICSKCDGKGTNIGLFGEEIKCWKCGGTGWIDDDDKWEFEKEGDNGTSKN